MIYTASTTLKKADTNGQISPQMLDHFVRHELAQLLIKAINPSLTIERSDQPISATAFVTSSTVDFTATLIVLNPHQWQQLNHLVTGWLATLPGDQQLLLQQLLDELAAQQLL
ncbi:MAG: hypothetical protein EOO39_23865 [Cytophagaceae bacterium]|nr:MAG: hypothetical protein EOO39_23865 [Cytophagaceae bacterium]